MIRRINRGIAVVSDVSIGFGSPQIPSMARALAEHYGMEAVIYEPDATGRAPARLSSEVFTVRRVTTELSPYCAPGRIEYNLKVARELNATRPAVVVVFCTFCLPVLLHLKYRPQATIYHLIEMVSAYGEIDARLNRCLAGKLDLLIFPEENRARLDIGRCGFDGVPMVVMYNVSDAPLQEFVAPAERMPRFYYGGTLDRDMNLADHFVRKESSAMPIDIFGNVAGRDKESLLAALESSVGAGRYCGYVNARELTRLRRSYSFSITMYSPHGEQTYYAAPNKMFEAIADGVPPIAAPHPLCKTIIERYRCGILMQDWSFEKFLSAVTEATDLFGSDAYRRMVENCREAVRAELNWDTQFAKVKRLLPKVA